ncbi:MAG TPA: kelch repeat-containing protein [Steroidobacteraceae bacterium]|nr:kelch repeat-containing protein [Steroidobacteraceae bacterium]
MLLTACGGKSNSSGTTSATTYSVGGSVSGLSETLVLQNNGGDNLSISQNGLFAFTTTLAPGAAYSVSILTQPTDQTCTITNASGTLQSSVSSVLVACASTTAVTDQWMWRSGTDSVDGAGMYGTEGSAAALNTPGARRQPSAWTDLSGNLWLFGGYGTGSAVGSAGMLNDLWEYSPTSQLWTWQGGSQASGAAASYGTLDMAAANNNPGAREGAASWSDAAGNLWLFGGDSVAAGGAQQFNDLWEYQPSSSQWTWIGGSSSAGNAGNYGTLGVAAAGNLPPARTNATSWMDGSGVFWLFGGAQLKADGSLAAVLDDLWSFSPSTGMWTWVSGSSAPNAVGVYGTEGTSAAGNLPGSRLGASAWVDAHGNFWLFGGEGVTQSGVSQQYNDLWEYSPGSDQWTWVNGSTAADNSGVYGTQGAGAAGVAPGARVASVTWQDSAGDLWLFGGYGYDQGGIVSELNDLWEYNLSTGLWTWVAGSSLGRASGSYGAEDTSTSSTMPGARQQAVGWRDASGTFWLFGGYGFDAYGAQQDLNDLWSYTPTP